MIIMGTVSFQHGAVTQRNCAETLGPYLINTPSRRVSPGSLRVCWYTPGMAPNLAGKSLDTILLCALSELCALQDTLLEVSWADV